MALTISHIADSVLTILSCNRFSSYNHVTDPVLSFDSEKITNCVVNGKVQFSLLVVFLFAKVLVGKDAVALMRAGAD